MDSMRSTPHCDLTLSLSLADINAQYSSFGDKINRTKHGNHFLSESCQVDRSTLVSG